MDSKAECGQLNSSTRSQKQRSIRKKTENKHVPVPT